MKVREIMNTLVQQISSGAMVSEAAERMRIFDIGALPVLAVAAGLDPKMTVIKDVFTPNVLCCFHEDEIETAAKIMEDKQVRRLVVLGDNNTVAGILSLSDLALKASIDHLKYEILERVCEPERR